MIMGVRSIERTGFTELLRRVSDVDPEMRIRFTSPHPKDFPDDLLYLIAERSNICKQIHVPAQSGSTSVLERMRRGYTRDSYLSLISLMKSIIPSIHISTDMISGFCGETESEHNDTLSLMKLVGYQQAFMFAYSQREKTYAHRHLPDDVPNDVKVRRLREVIDTFHVYHRSPSPMSFYHARV
jgi:tRNA A37 methylthiotransferase MiaB